MSLGLAHWLERDVGSVVGGPMSRNYFGTDGIRGRANGLITPELALKVGQAAGLVGCEDSNLDALVGKPPANLPHVSLNSPDRRGKARCDLEHTEVGCSSRHDYDADRGAGGGAMIAERFRAAELWLYYPV